jgi:hypothetical protein
MKEKLTGQKHNLELMLSIHILVYKLISFKNFDLSGLQTGICCIMKRKFKQ